MGTILKTTKLKSSTISLLTQVGKLSRILPKTLHQKLMKTPSQLFHELASSQNTFCPQPVDTNTVVLTIKQLKESNSCGPDNISLKFIKDPHTCNHTLRSMCH